MYRTAVMAQTKLSVSADFAEEASYTEIIEDFNLGSHVVDTQNSYSKLNHK